jgi:hypothetical protein
MKPCPLCGLTKNQMLDRILKAAGHAKGKSKYSDEQITKSEMACIYRYVMQAQKKENENEI